MVSPAVDRRGLPVAFPPAPCRSEGNGTNAGTGRRFFQGSVFTEPDRKSVARTGAERFCLKAGRRIPNRSYEEYVAGRGRKKPEAGLPAAADTRPASGRLFRKHFLHVARMQFLVYSVAFDIYRIEVVQLEYDT